jgi:general secretion pathway protein D
VQTNVSLGDGQTLALGGLVQESDNLTTTETPGLGKIPVLGNLFRRKESTRSRSELLILIRPRVIGGDAEAALVTDYWRNKLTTANTLLGSGLGPPTHTIVDVAE